MRCLQDKRHGYLLSILPHRIVSANLYSRKSLEKKLHERLQQDDYFLREKRGTRRAPGTALGMRSELRCLNSRRIQDHISNDGRSNRAPPFIGEIYATHTQRGADAKKVRPGKDSAFRHRQKVIDL